MHADVIISHFMFASKEGSQSGSCEFIHKIRESQAYIWLAVAVAMQSAGSQQAVIRQLAVSQGQSVGSQQAVDRQSECSRQEVDRQLEESRLAVGR